MSSFRIFRVAGISVELHITFILFLMLLLLFAGVASFLFFLIVFFFVLLHELSHSLVAKHGGVVVSKIVLTFFGGIANIDIPEDPKMEFKMAVAGPLFNFLMVFLSFMLISGLGIPVIAYSELLGGAGKITPTYLLLLVFYINLILGLFNIIPGFPMDGGRIVRSLLAMRMDYVDATRLAVSVGRYLVFPLFFLMGILTGNIFLLIIPVFLFVASTNELRFLGLRRAFRGLRMGDIAIKKFQHVNGDITLFKFMELLANPLNRFYIVTDSAGKVMGTFDMESARKINQRYDETLLRDVVDPEFPTIDASVTVERGFKNILTTDFLLVVDDSKVLGYITPELLTAMVPFYSLRRNT